MPLNDFNDLAFEDSLSDDWSRDMQTVELRLDSRPTRFMAVILLALVSVIGLRVFYINVVKGSFYTSRAEANVNRTEHILAPRGLVVDRYGKVLAQNRSVFRAVLNVDEYSKKTDLQEKTLRSIESILGIPRAEVQGLLDEAAAEESSSAIVLEKDISQAQIVALKALALPTIAVKDAFMRDYPYANTFSSVLGYVSLPTAKDLENNPKLSSEDLVGKAGLEAYYDAPLQGTPGQYVRVKNAKGQIVEEGEKSAPQIGKPLTLTIDMEFQQYFFNRLAKQFESLGRSTGGAIAINPQNGEVLALMSFPNYDSNVLSSPGRSEEKRAILNSTQQPLFNRMVGGNYSPASTIKLIDSVAILKEKIIDPNRTIFSPGYLDIPNVNNPSKPTRYLDWRYQGNVNVYSAIAQSSDVYFYETIGGFGDIKGLGITRLKEWWLKFGLGKPTHIDLPSEGKGFLPDPEWKMQKQKSPWLLGDTFNVSIGQGDFQVTPIQLIDAIASIANGGKLYQPVLNKEAEHPKLLADLTYLAPEMKEVQKGMFMTVTSPLGTAHLLNDLPFPVAAKTGTAQIHNNTAENSFFTGYIPPTNKINDDGNSGAEILILILVENAKQGSLNTVPVGKDVLNWYYEHRIKK
jgi:penicillin-binding protein 2